MAVEEQVIQLYAGTSRDAEGTGWIRNVPVDQVQRYMEELLEFMRTRHPEVGQLILEKQKLDDDVKAAIDGAFAEFAKVFQAESPEQAG